MTTARSTLLWWIPIVILVLFGLLFVFQTSKTYIPLGSDFTQDYVSGVFLLKQESVYGVEITTWARNILGFENVGNNHPPVHAIPFMLFALVPYSVAHWLFNALSVVACLLTTCLIGRECRWTLRTSILCFGAVLFWAPFQETIALGQTSAILGFLTSLGIVALVRGRSAVSGGCFAIGVLCKLFPALLILPLVALRRWRSLGYLFGATALGFLVFSLVGRSADIQEFFVSVAPANAELWSYFPPSGSLRGLIVPFFKITPWSSPIIDSPVWGYWMLWVMQGILLGASALVLWRRRDSRDQDIVRNVLCLTVVTMLILSPIAWPHYALFLLYPMALAGSSAQSRVRYLALASLVLFSIPQYELLRSLQDSLNMVRVPWYLLPLLKGTFLGFLFLWIAFFILCWNTAPHSHSDQRKVL